MSTKLLLLHGALGSAAQLEPLADHLRDRFDVFTYDFPGHGGKPFPEHPLTLPILAAHLHEYVREFDLIGSPVFGYSMGGYAALWLESKEQGTFSQIMTLATKFNWRPETAEKEASFLQPEKMELKVPAFAKHLEERHLPNDWKRVVTETAALMHHLGTHALKQDDWGNVNCKVRLCVGDRDQTVTMEETARVYTELPLASLSVLPNTQHPFEKMNLQYLSDEIKRFIDA